MGFHLARPVGLRCSSIARIGPSSRAERIIDTASERVGHDGTTFTDRDVYRHLKAAGLKNSAGEWFKCRESDVRAAIVALRSGAQFEHMRDLDFAMRPEQKEAVELSGMYEDPSLMYTGICKHEGEDIGLFDTVLSADDYRATFESVVNE